MKLSSVHTNRASYVRGLAESAIETLGAGDEERGIAELARVCVDEGNRRGIRVWKGETCSSVASGVTSIRRLLKITRTRTSKGFSTGSNYGWVLELIENGASRVIHGKQPLPETVQPEPTLNGPVLRKLVEMQTLSMRVLEAYISRNDQGILAVAEELEKRGL